MTELALLIQKLKQHLHINVHAGLRSERKEIFRVFEHYHNLILVLEETKYHSCTYNKNTN